MTQENTSLEYIWSQIVGDDPGPDPYANCDSCDQGCSNSGLDPAPANFNNIVNDFLQKAQNDGESQGTTIQNIMDQISAQNRARAKLIALEQEYQDLQGNNPPVINPNRPGGGSSSSSGMEVENQGNNQNPTGGGFIGGTISNDSVSWNPSQDIRNFSAKGYFNAGQAVGEALGFGAKALRTATTPTPENAQQNNCATDGGEKVKKATPLTEALGENDYTLNSSRLMGVTGGGTWTAGAGSINNNPVNSNGTAPLGNPNGRLPVPKSP